MIIEFAGLPRSGKSTSIGVVKNYFSRGGQKTKLVAEGARSCPFSNRHRIEFACWTANQALSAVMEASLDDSKTLVLQDRGLLDALAFLHLLQMENLVDDLDARRYLEYFGNPFWLQRVDLVFLFLVEPATALRRDLAATLNAPPAVITNVKTMERLRGAYDHVEAEFGKHLPQIVRIDTTHRDPLETMKVVVEAIQHRLEATE